ncbi:hypothetical protein HPB51_011712 [Rhipicephalus microplus]|uniref:Uncharacterized protein n=1 Tax=Rhipicephalus microplus TaxID=6941 RepID=A0A9J6DM34_RHIMP|nr:hypothetical protein HPB51_011712 [Rhipicephalus microplus]
MAIKPWLTASWVDHSKTWMTGSQLINTFSYYWIAAPRIITTGCYNMQQYEVEISYDMIMGCRCLDCGVAHCSLGSSWRKPDPFRCLSARYSQVTLAHVRRLTADRARNAQWRTRISTAVAQNKRPEAQRELQRESVLLVVPPAVPPLSTPSPRSGGGGRVPLSPVFKARPKEEGRPQHNTLARRKVLPAWTWNHYAPRQLPRRGRVKDADLDRRPRIAT